MRINLKNIFIGNPFYNGRYLSYDWEFLMKRYKAIVNKDMLVVEIGCSNFHKTIDLSRYCKKLIGIEIDKTKIYPHQASIEIINADWQNLNTILKLNSVDIIVSSHVIEHVPDDLKALDESYEVLKPTGQLLFITPNKNRLTRYIAQKLHLDKHFLYDEHEREYTENDILNLLLKSKFKNYTIDSVALGLHSGRFMLYFKNPKYFKKLTNFFVVQLQK